MRRVIFVLVQTHDVLKFAAKQRKLSLVQTPKLGALRKQVLESRLRTQHELLLDVFYF